MTLTFNSHTIDVERGSVGNANPSDFQCACVALVTGMHMDTVREAVKHAVTRYRMTRGTVNGIWFGDPEERDMPSTKFELLKIFEQGYRIKITHYGGQ